MRLVLASASPRRQVFLRDLGWEFQVIASNTDEGCVPGESPEEMVRRLAAAKASDVWARAGAHWVIGADTIVVIDGDVLGKPADELEAKRMICTLQGRTHVVMTGVTVIRPDGVSISRVEKTEVTFRTMTEDEAEAYVEQKESMDKAGAYAIQGKGTMLVERVNGCYFNVVGLPLECLSRMLAELGWPLAEQWRASV